MCDVKAKVKGEQRELKRGKRRWEIARNMVNVYCILVCKHCYESESCVQCQLKISKYSKGINIKVIKSQ